MTKAELIYMLQRYHFIANGIRSNKKQIIVYIGNRKEVIDIDEQVKTVFSVIDDIMSNESPLIVKIMTYWLKYGHTDEAIIIRTPVSRSSYYRLKRTIENKIYQCCILRGLVTYEELLSDKIG